MKSLFRGTLMMSVLGGPILASSGTTSDWLGLDEELNSLASTVNLQGNEPNFGALLRTAVLNTGDFGTTEDVLGVSLEDAKLWADGSLGDWNWRVMYDFANRTQNAAGYEVADWTDIGFGFPEPTYVGALQDAYASWNINETLTLTLGQFRAPTTRSMWVATENMLFQRRSALGQWGYLFDEGVMLSGQYESNFAWWISAQNGADGLDDDLRLNARAQYTFGSWNQSAEGAWVETDEFEGTVGIFVGDDGDADGAGTAGIDGGYMGVDFTGNVGRFSFSGEFANLDNGSAGNYGFVNGGATFTDDASPWAAAVSYMLSPEEWEIGARYENLDDTADTTLLTLGLNYYMTGHNSKVQLNFLQADSDAPSIDGSLISLGLTLGLEGYDA